MIQAIPAPVLFRGLKMLTEEETTFVDNGVRHKPQLSLNELEFKRLKEHATRTGVPLATKAKNLVLAEVGMGPLAGKLAPAQATTKPVALVGFTKTTNGDELREEAVRDVFCSEHPSGDSFRYLEIEDDSMNKQVPEGAYALYRDIGIDFGQTVAVVVDGKSMLRVYQLDAKFKCARLDPDSSNPNHKSILVKETDPKSSKHLWVRPAAANIRGVFTGDYIVKGKTKE